MVRRNVVTQPLVALTRTTRVVHVTFIWTQRRHGLTEDPFDVRIAGSCSTFTIFVAKVTISAIPG